MSHSAAKNPFNPRISATELTGDWCSPAITATNVWASAVATNAHAIARDVRDEKNVIADLERAARLDHD